MASTVSDDFTVLLNRAADGDGSATEAVWSRSYDELLAIARGIRPSRTPGSAVVPSPTTIIHESFMKTFGPRAADGDRPAWDSRAHFFGSVARAMGQFIVDWRRTSTRQKRGGSARAVEFIDHDHSAGGSSRLFEADELIELLPRIAEALERLRERAPELADVVWMRCFAGLSLEDTALVLGIRPRTVSKRWNLGRALLRRDLSRPIDAGRRASDSALRA